MKNKSFNVTIYALLLCALILTLVGCAGGSGWTKVSKSSFDYNDNMDGFLNENYGITVGFSGEIHYTTDGGKTWPRAENSSMCRFSLDIVDESLAWTGGNGSQIRVSRDGGKTWQAVTDSPLGGVVSGIDFVDDKTGWICTTARLAASTDGGNSWNQIDIPAEAVGIAAIQLRTEKDGYILSRDGKLYVTADDGASWETRDIGIENYEIVNEKGELGLFKFNSAVADIAFTDETNGKIVFCGTAPNKGSLVWCVETKDGGESWKGEQVAVEEGFTANRIFLSEDGQYLTLGSFGREALLLKLGK